MLTCNLRRVGGSTMFTVPAELLKMLHLRAGDTVALSVDNGRLIVEPQRRPRYTLTELLAASDYAEPPTDEERAWLDAGAAGRELL